MYNWDGELANLKKEIRELKEENKKLKKELGKEREEKQDLLKKIEKIQREFEEYKARHPETVGVKHGKPYIIKSQNTSQTPKKPGAKKGHKAHFRPIPKHIDNVCHVPVFVCPICKSTDLSDDVQETRERMIEDIVIPKPIVTKYTIDRRYCRDCKKIVETPVTAALPGARLGIRVMLVVVWLKIKLRLTEEAIPELLEKLFGIKISEGEVIHILSQVADAFGPYYEQLLQEIRKAPARYIDETSWRINGQNVWLWAFVTRGETLYKIASSRSHEVPLEVLGEKHNGVDIHDRFSAYEALARKTGNPQQVSWSHIINDSKELAQFYGEEGVRIHQTLKKIYNQAKTFDHKGTKTDIGRILQELTNELDRPYKSHRCNKFVEYLLKDKNNLFEFVKNPDVDGTNNAAERAIRPVVIARKISGGNRSAKGAEVYEILHSIIQTLHLNGQNLIDHGASILLTSHG